jgi:hypothetical protein
MGYLERRHAESDEWVNAMLAAVADAGNPSSNLEIVYALVTLVGGFLGAAITYFARRRVTAGRVSTSNADVLWQQSQAMRDMLLKEKEMAESQRDKMIEINGQLFPMLDNINSALIRIGDSLKEEHNGTGRTTHDRP